MEKTVDYNFTDHILAIGGKRALETVLNTKEFGPLKSRAVFVDGDPNSFSDIDIKVLNSLADDLIAEYQDRLKFLKKKQ